MRSLHSTSKGSPLLSTIGESPHTTMKTRTNRAKNKQIVQAKSLKKKHKKTNFKPQGQRNTENHKNYYEQLHDHKLDNLEEIDKFLEM